MKKKIMIDKDFLTVIEYKKAGLFSNEVVEDNKITVPTHTIELVQKAYNGDGISSVAVFFELDADEFFFTQDDIENDLQELFDEFIKIRNELLQIQDFKNIYRIEEYNIDTRETIDK